MHTQTGKTYTLPQVPDINVKELMIEIELVANTLLEWTASEGWKVSAAAVAAAAAAADAHSVL